MIYGNPRALSSALAPLGTLEPRALGFLNCVVSLISASNYISISKGILSRHSSTSLHTMAMIFGKSLDCALIVV